MSTFGDQIRARRIALDLTQDELARKAGLSKGFLSDLENGKRNVSAEKLLDVARALGVSIDALMSLADVKPSMGEVQIPASLAELARSENLPFSKLLMLLDMQRQIVAHRSVSRKDPDLDSVDWRRFYDSVKEFL
jgi:y4mF family transcriptional regulator